jgi:hypothetical protein
MRASSLLDHPPFPGQDKFKTTKTASPEENLEENNTLPIFLRDSYLFGVLALQNY